MKEYDAVFLNSIVGEFLPDPAMRADLVRYVNEGGGLGGIHGTPWASTNWDEFARRSARGPHRIASRTASSGSTTKTIPSCGRSTSRICHTARSITGSTTKATAGCAGTKCECC